MARNYVRKQAVHRQWLLSRTQELIHPVRSRFIRVVISRRARQHLQNLRKIYDWGCSRSSRKTPLRDVIKGPRLVNEMRSAFQLYDFAERLAEHSDEESARGRPSADVKRCYTSSNNDSRELSWPCQQLADHVTESSQIGTDQAVKSRN